MAESLQKPYDLSNTGFMGPELIRVAIELADTSNGEMTAKDALKYLGELGAQQLRESADNHPSQTESAPE